MAPSNNTPEGTPAGPATEVKVAHSGAAAPQAKIVLPQVRREDVEFMPDTLQAIFQRPPRTAFLIVKCTLAFLVIAIIWAAFSPLDEITVGEGKVIPSSQVQIIQNLEGGIVSKIPVKVGDLVQKGQIVLQLDETRFASSMGESKAKNNALYAKVSRLSAESTGQPFVPPADLVRDNPSIAREEKVLFDSRQRELTATLSVLTQQASQRGQELVEKRARLGQLQDNYTLIDRELKMSKPLVAQGVISEVEILRLERQVGEIRGEMEATRLAIPRLEAQITEARSKSEGALAKYRSDAANELALARAEYAGTSASNVAVEDRLARTAVRSPLSGIVKSMKVTTVGGVIQPGMDVMEIVPVEGILIIEAKVRPGDVGFLRPGQSALVKISAYDFSIYGGLEAVVENITADSITNEKNDSWYLVRVRTEKSSLGSPEKPLTIIPGMLATVNIRTGEKSLLSYLLKPVIKARSNALTER
jgi:adhesin transport system membrane fusion protein